ncbi:MAG: glycosyltransferase family 39 protein [Edaphobacter sp.]|uniref:ArnT family glycosyltransferase n=1 Tax=Edaphobacter sp. TaxID=1934404 RepID=UPI002383A28A|nr:glycosyltransferase family 39 protein [Edaphobacter sp.]MDE1177405.1 glycosyltransferase family 39 protein [Edaphobacter sp.]
MAESRARSRTAIGAPLALGLALRIAFITNAARVAGDTLLYGDIAKNWMQFGVYGFARTDTGAVPTLIRLPGYPIFLALCFKLFGPDCYFQVMLVQAVIDLLTCLLIADLARRVFGNRAGLLALWLGVLCPFTANYVAAPLTETLTLFCIALAFYALERWRAAGASWNRWLWIVTAALSYSILLRPEQGLLAAAVVPAMIWLATPFTEPRRLSRVVPIVAASICVLLPLVPWTIRNWRTFHVIQPLAPRYATDPGEPVYLGFQRWYRTWAIDFSSTENVYWNWDSDDINIDDIPSRAFDSDQQYNQVDALLTTYNANNNNTNPAIEQAFDKLADERIADDPVRYYLAMPFARLADMLLRPRVEMMEVPLHWWQWKTQPRRTALVLAYALLNLAYLLLGLYGLWCWRRQRWNGHAALAFATIAFVLLRCAMLLNLDNSEPRYTLELFPLLQLWAAAILRDRPASSPAQLS